MGVRLPVRESEYEGLSKWSLAGFEMIERDVMSEEMTSGEAGGIGCAPLSDCLCV